MVRGCSRSTGHSSEPFIRNVIRHHGKSRGGRLVDRGAMDVLFFKKTFRERRLRVSHARLVVFQELSRNRKALSPRELYQGLLRKKKGVGLTSVYRSLELLASLGIVFKTMSGTVTRYKLCGLAGHHHHIVCERCGEVVEFDFCDLPHWTKRLARMTGYQITAHHFDFVGLCRGCQKKV